MADQGQHDPGGPQAAPGADPSRRPNAAPDPTATQARGQGILDRFLSTPYRNEVLALVVLCLVTAALPWLAPGGPGRYPAGLLIIGAGPGAALAMQAMGVVLVFRSNRFINFGQLYLGNLAASFFVLMSQYTPLYRTVTSVCPECLDVEDLTRTQYVVHYFASAVLALGVGLVAAWLMYVLVVKRFERRPRLIVTVASVFVGSAAIAIIGLMRNTMTTVEQREDGLLAASSPLPYDVDFLVGGQHVNLGQLLSVVVGVTSIVALAVYLRRSRIGRGIRAAADNPARAELLGINVHQVHTRVWFLVGALTAVPAILATMSGELVQYEGANVNNLMMILLVAVFARFMSLPMAGAAAFVVSILRTTSLYAFGNQLGPFNGAMVFLVAGLLLLRARERSTRADVLASATLNTEREIRPIPKELRDLPSVRTGVRSLAILGAIFVVALPWTLSPGQTNLAAIPFIYGIVGLSLLILTGWAGQISLGQFAFAAIGGYVVAVWQVPFFVSLVGAAVVGAVVATLVGIPALRLKGLYLAITTMALAVSVTAVVVSPQYLGKHLPANLPRPALFGMDLEDQRTFYYVSLVVLAGAVFAVKGLRNSRIGRVLIAARENEQAVQSFGVSLVRARLTAFAISGAFAAFAGGLYAFHQHGMPLNSFDENQSMAIFTMSVIGGLGSTAGPLIGAAYTGILLVFKTSPAVTGFFLGFGGLGLLLLAPGGLGQVFFGLRDAFLRRVAKRHRLIVPSLIADQKAERGDGRVPVAPKVRATGGTAFVPQRYELGGQWALVDDVAVERSSHDDFAGLGADRAPELIDG